MKQSKRLNGDLKPEHKKTINIWQPAHYSDFEKKKYLLNLQQNNFL